jgi:hypothetical protein
MRINNEWIGYLQRSYQQIKTSLVVNLKAKAPEITDYTESNPMIILLSMFAGLTEHLNYYIDAMAQEMFVSSARRFSSVVKLANFLDYYSKGAIGSFVSIKISLKASGNPLGSTTSWVIPAGTIFRSSDSAYQFYTQKEYRIEAGVSEFEIEAQNKIPGATLVLGVANNTSNQTFRITNGAYTNESATILVDTLTYVEVKTLAFSRPTDLHYIVRLGLDGFLYVTFGDGVNGRKPVAGNVQLNYSTTSGSNFNNIPAGSVTLSNTNLLALTVGPTQIEITNPTNPNGGADLEDIDRLKQRIPKSLRTLDRAVTYQDYYDLLQLAPGVEKGEIDFCCSNSEGVVLYVVPHGGGIAGNSLLTQVNEFFDTRRILGTKTNPKPAGQILIRFQVEAAIFSGYNLSETANLILTTLRNNYNYLNREINENVRLSDITTLISNLTPVDYIKSLIIEATPYAKPFGTTVNVLDITFVTLITATQKVVYKLVYNGTNWVLYKGNLELAIVTTGVLYANTDISFTINAATYTAGDTYEFTVYPYNQDIIITDFSLALYEPNSTAVCTRDTQTIRNKNC